MHKKEIEKIFNFFHSQNYSPNTELYYNSPYTLLIAVMLSAQATDQSVNKATSKLFKTISSPEQMIELGENKLKTFIKTIGLFNNKAKNIILTSKILIEDFNSEVPKTRDKLESLPGVGRKTANVVLNEAFGFPTIAVDTHIFRLSNRIGLSKGKNPLEVELDLEKKIPKKWKKNAHHWLILHGRYICKARKPICSDCMIRNECKYYKTQFKNH